MLFSMSIHRKMVTGTRREIRRVVRFQAHRQVYHAGADYSIGEHSAADLQYLAVHSFLG
jgi:hypothetical protein